MLSRIKADTFQSDPYILGKLQAAQDWIWNRLFTMNKSILTVNDQLTMAGDTRSYNLAANVSTGTLYGIEFLGVRFASDTDFVPVDFVSESSAQFIYWDQQDVQPVHPQAVVITSFNQVRFAPGLPSGTVIRADYVYKPRTLSLSQQADPDLPEVFHETQVSEATSRVFKGIDDTRSQEYHVEAMDALYGALNVLGVRQFQQQPRTRPSNSGRRRLVY